MKTNGTLLTHALRCTFAGFFFFIYSESPAQTGFGSDAHASPGGASQAISPTLINKSNSVAANNSKANSLHAGFYDEMTGTVNGRMGDTSMEGPVAKPAEIYISNQTASLRKYSSVHFIRSSFIYPRNPSREVGLNHFETARLLLYAQMLKKYAVANHFDTTYAFLANMGILSNRKRFFVINLKTMEVEQSGLVSHGRGPGMSIYDRNYSNDPDSKCTSLGRYKIASTYRGTYGLSYHIAGLDSSNSNAQKRKIVLHSMHCIPDMESIMPACVSEGCPAVSERFFSSIRKLIDTRKKPMLLWIIDSNLELPEITETPVEELAVAKPVSNKAAKMIQHEETVKAVKVAKVVIKAKKNTPVYVYHRQKKTEYAGLVKGDLSQAGFTNPTDQMNEIFGFRK